MGSNLIRHMRHAEVGLRRGPITRADTFLLLHGKEYCWKIGAEIRIQFWGEWIIGYANITMHKEGRGRRAIGLESGNNDLEMENVACGWRNGDLLRPSPCLSLQQQFNPSQKRWHFISLTRNQARDVNNWNGSFCQHRRTGKWDGLRVWLFKIHSAQNHKLEINQEETVTSSHCWAGNSLMWMEEWGRKLRLGLCRCCSGKNFTPSAAVSLHFVFIPIVVTKAEV